MKTTPSTTTMNSSIRLSTTAFFLALSTFWTILPAAAVTIENQWLKVTLDPADSTLQITEKTSGRVVFKDGILPHAQLGVAEVTPEKDTNFGNGQAIRSGRSKVALYSGLPFALVSATLANPSDKPASIGKISLLTVAVDSGKAASETITLGTGGIMKPGTPSGKPATTTPKRKFRDDVDLNTDESVNDLPPEIPGSYVWALVADPKSRNGAVVAWLTHDRATGVVFAKAGETGAVLEARSEYGLLEMPSNGKLETETLALGYFDDARLGMEQWADAVAKHYRIKLNPQLSGYCTWYDAPPHHRSGYEAATAELAEFAGREMKPFGLDFIQIDDGWQVGGRDFRSHNAAPRAPYKSGMKFTADNIRKAGLAPGLWSIPCVAPDASMPDFCAKTADGKPYQARWTGFCLDMTKPGARDFMRENISRMTKEWGYTYLKLDGFHAASATPNVYVHSEYKEDHFGESIIEDPAKGHIGAFRDGIKLLRSTTGPDVFLLACAMTQNMRSYGGSFGLVDAMRVGPDNGCDWGKWLNSSATFGSRHYFENRRIWYVDPDPPFVRESLPLEQARAMCSWTCIAGQLFVCSDWLPTLPPERLDILKRTMMPHKGISRPVDFLDGSERPSMWLLSDTGRATRRDVLALFNWTDKPATIGNTIEHIGLDPAVEYVAFDFWGDQMCGPFRKRIEKELPPRSCMILAVRPVATVPQLLSTSRHVTQGMVDVMAETWNSAQQSLVGRSKLIANDPYELRIVVPNGTAAARAEVDTQDEADGVKVVEVRREGNLVRVRLLSPLTREVHWKVRF